MVEQATKKADSQANKLLVTENDALVIDAVKNKALQRLCQTKVIWLYKFRVHRWNSRSISDHKQI